jgi:hypothetical protein
MGQRQLVLCIVVSIFSRRGIPPQGLIPILRNAPA